MVELVALCLVAWSFSALCVSGALALSTWTWYLMESYRIPPEPSENFRRVVASMTGEEPVQDPRAEPGRYVDPVRGAFDD